MGKITTLLTAIVMTMVTESAQTATGYEWWFDDDVSSAQTGDVSSGQISIMHDLSGVTRGVHFFNLRLRDSEGTWGAPYRRMVITSSSETVQ